MSGNKLRRLRLSIRSLLVLVAGLLTVNLVLVSLMMADESVASGPLVSAHGPCRLPTAITRRELDALAAKVVKTLNDNDSDGYAALHTVRPDMPTVKSKHRYEAMLKMGIGMFNGMGTLGDLQPDSFQNFQYVGEWNGREVFLINYAVSAEPKVKHLPNAAVVGLNIAYDGKSFGLAKVEVKFQPIRKK